MNRSFHIIKKLSILFVLPVFMILFLSACQYQKPASGDEYEIFVIADSLEYERVEGSLLNVFSKIIYTPQPEKLFELKRKPFRQLDKYKGRKNLIILAPLSSGTSVSKYLQKIIDPAVQEMVDSDSLYVINKHDLWAKNQLVMFLTAPTIEKLDRKILEGHKNLIYYFQKISDKRLYAALYNPKYEQKNIEAKLLNQYDWMIYVQADFLLALDSPEDNFVWIRRAPGTDMERWMFIHWIDDASPEFLKAGSIANERNKLTAKYYRTSDERAHVEISDDYHTTKEVNFLNRYTLMTQGLWRMTDKSMGGPFVNYTFYDEQSKRIYMLDASIYAPKYYKKKLIQQMDVILQSFLTRAELSEERIEDLMDELEE